jgi:hypothetical protein
VAGRALGRGLRVCLAKHGLTEEHLVSLRLSVVTELADHQMTCELRRGFLEAMNSQSQASQAPLRGDSAESEAERRGCCQITVISASKLSVARPTSRASREETPGATSILLEAVAAGTFPTTSDL